MCFGGKVNLLFTCTDRYSDSGLKVTFFDTDWNKLPFKRHYPSDSKKIARPSELELMISISERLSKGLKFVRVDLYEAKGKVYFGELTLYPGAGMEEFTPEEWDKRLGDLLELK